MANRIMLNQTSYHGAGAIQELPAEVKSRGLKKALICCGPDSSASRRYRPRDRCSGCRRTEL